MLNQHLANALLTVSVAFTAHAQAPPKLPWGIGPQSVTPINVPTDVRGAVAADLEYDDDAAIKGIESDFNGDAVADFLLQSAPSLCGNGGCVYLLIDGKTRKMVGEFFGSPLYVRAERTHGYPNITTYSHLSADAATFTEYSFDGRSYVVTSKRTLNGSAADRLTETLRQIPILRP